ncbi:MAG: hypothetical protein GYA17_02895 [Chloroflexi bacterium]|nr:hypothetical protein [Chloroflexota bacterium]
MKEGALEAQYYEIRLEGELGKRWEDWFGGMQISHPEENQTLLAGWLPDQAALHGVLFKVRDLRLVLISVIRIDRPVPGEK